ncbi:TPA: hypothetical protein QDC20_005596 [Burkholderia aenigmatica]|uniref:hypothetical protein n=1 Tax=Burkholderia sp. AU45251 TaxID=3059204 RepID=UPI00264C4622|nr:hypothetical protein [Burkholderia sp. AU45251]HDR9484929.1 hypothetical protein [Burkholderia aenigmatica]MDN7517482.1 hypothetical protein [Burkholderia sp. AU45251]HDR9516476.1 hypothetical protein [Burkholderia aenigmatica]HDR9593536.1 hypothetical protein [Burkholderia aenigmatica]HDR9604441.1 hypothetical protein [Burkholderia aenigmatica]
MKKICLAVVVMAAYSIGWAASPGESLVKSCLLAQSVSQSVAIEGINTHEVSQEDAYAAGYNASYLVKHDRVDVGYAEGKSTQALIYSGKLYRLPTAMPIGNNGGIKPAAFNPALAEWSIAREGRQRYLCVSFNFDGLGRSGSFQNVRGGYLLDSVSRVLYFFVRNVDG